MGHVIPVSVASVAFDWEVDDWVIDLLSFDDDVISTGVAGLAEGFGESAHPLSRFSGVFCTKHPFIFFLVLNVETGKVLDAVVSRADKVAYRDRTNYVH